MLPNVSINITGSINRPALNKDGVTGFVFYNNNIDDLTDFTTSNRIIKFTNLETIKATGLTSSAVHFTEEFYQLSEFFRMGGTECYIGIFPIPVSTYDYTEIEDLKLYSNGEIKIYAIYNQATALNVSNIALIQAILEDLDAVKKSAVAVYSGKTSTIATFAALPDLRDLASNCPLVSVVIGLDIDNTLECINLGTVVGALSGATVSTNILNTGVYNYTDGSSMVNVGFNINSAIVDITTINEADLDTLNDKGYIFWRYLPNLAGTYLSNDNNSTELTDTFNSIHINRVKAKVIRELDKSLSKLIGSKLLFNSDGTLRKTSAKVFEDSASLVLSEMKNQNDISAYDVFVDTTLNVLATKTVTVNCAIVPTESADYITINVAFTQSI